MLLALDTSTAQVGLALYDGTQVTAELSWHSQAHHTQELAPALSGLLSRIGATMDSLRAMGVAIGPGSFTSLRVGLAFAKGLSLARRLPLVGIPTLDVAAACVACPGREGAPGARRRLAAVLQAGRGRLALIWYRAGEGGWQAEGPAQVTTAEALARKIRERVVICGELDADQRSRLARKFRNVELASPAQCVRRPGVLAELAWQRWKAGQVDAPASLAPIYLHVAGSLPS
jgi:tRNA threonylcarbamoyladenosine biosynthesis protein TsaB